MRVIRAEQLVQATGDENAALARACGQRVRFELAGVCVELCTDVEGVAELFGLRYADHPATREADFRYYVARVRGGYAFWCAHTTTWRWSKGALPPDGVAFLADAVILTALVRFDGALSSMRAAAVESNGVAAALTGYSVLGKAATLLACARLGMRIYSDDRVLMRQSIVHPFLRRCSVRAAGARLFLRDRDERVGQERAITGLSLKTCLGPEAIAAPRPLRALFKIAGDGDCASLERIDTAAALPAVTRWFDARGDVVDRVSRAIATLQGARCYRLVLGSPDENAAAIAYALTHMNRE